jgi:hypothetical protein
MSSLKMFCQKWNRWYLQDDKQHTIRAEGTGMMHDGGLGPEG